MHKTFSFLAITLISFSTPLLAMQRRTVASDGRPVDRPGLACLKYTPPTDPHELTFDLTADDFIEKSGTSDIAHVYCTKCKTICVDGHCGYTKKTFSQAITEPAAARRVVEEAVSFSFGANRTPPSTGGSRKHTHRRRTDAICVAVACIKKPLPGRPYCADCYAWYNPRK